MTELQAWIIVWLLAAEIVMRIKGLLTIINYDYTYENATNEICRLQVEVLKELREARKSAT